MDQTEDPTSPLGGIDVTTVPGRTVVRMWGEVDGALRAEASTSMAQALASSAPVVVDASGVTFIDSSGLAFVLQLHLAATETGQRLTLRDPGREVVGRLDLIGMAGEIDLEPEAAVA
jgi:anti-anti-sigma factor